jgi:structural maintenance of chromosome 3 (chondroitin sulfate proteoglycan 6)
LNPRNRGEQPISHLSKEKYQQLDRQPRSLEYTIVEKELQGVKKKLEEIEEPPTKVSKKSTNMYNSVLEVHEHFKTLEKYLKNLSMESQAMVKEKDVAEKQKTEAMKRRAKVELDLRDFEGKINGEGRMKEDVAKELKSLEKETKKQRR